MGSKAQGSIDMGDWDEQPYVEIDDGRKLTKTSVTQTFTGDVTGDGSATWLAAYRPDGTADYVGFQRIVGTVGDAEGSVVLRMTGGYDGSIARSEWEVVDGTGTGGLERLSGRGVSEATSEGKVTYSLDYDLG